MNGQTSYNLDSICVSTDQLYTLVYSIDGPNPDNITLNTYNYLGFEDGDYTGSIKVKVTTSPVNVESAYITVYYTISKDSCLTEDTLITMADGSEKQIKDVKLGETVKTINQTTGEFEIGIVRYNRGLDNRTFDNYDLWTFENGTTIKTITKHRLFNATKSAYIYLTDWDIGDEVLFEDGTTSKLVNHENIKQTVVSYSLIVDQETYIANHMLNGTRRANPITPYSQYNGNIE